MATYFGVCLICSLACMLCYFIGHQIGRRKGAEEMEAIYKGIAREMRKGDFK